MIKITFTQSDGVAQTVEAQPGQTVMEAAVANGIPGIDAECGGSMSCATCHCYVDAGWFDKTGEPGQDESDLLEFGDKPMQPTSRLSCQITISNALDGLTVAVPG